MNGFLLSNTRLVKGQGKTYSFNKTFSNLNNPYKVLDSTKTKEVITR